MMEDNARIIAAAKRCARRLTKKTPDLTYQQALDQIARDLGRQHWAAFMADPVEVPRDILGTSVQPPDPTRKNSSSEINRAPGLSATKPWPSKRDAQGWTKVEQLWSAWNVPTERRDGDLTGTDFFMPGWNVLNSVTMPSSGPQRERYIDLVVDVVMTYRSGGKGPGSEYWFEKGGQSLRAFILADIAAARDRGDDPSIPAMMNTIRGCMGHASKMHERREEGEKTDFLHHVFQSMLRNLPTCPEAQQAADLLRPILACSPNERSGILGTMERALIVFRNPEIAALNA